MDFSAFDRKFSVGEYVAETLQRTKYYFRVTDKLGIFFALVGTFAVLFYFALAVGLIVFGWVSYSDNSDSAALVVALLFTLIFITGLALVFQVIRTIGTNALRMQKFAEENKLEYLPHVGLRNDQGFAFSVQTRKIARNGSTGKASGRNFWLFEYRFMSGTGGHPYPNIFTVFMVQVENNFPEVLIANKKGRLKIIWPRGEMKKVNVWPELSSKVTVYSQNKAIGANIGKKFDQHKMNQLLEIYPKAEVQLWGHTLTIFIPGKQQPSAKLAEQLFEFAKTV